VGVDLETSTLRRPRPELDRWATQTHTKHIRNNSPSDLCVRTAAHSIIF